MNVTFDNIGGNAALGFNVSPASRYFCRTCVCPKEETRLMIKDSPEKYRNLEQYNRALEIIRKSKKVDVKATYGVYENCQLNKLNYFHILDNLNADIMHDICEGINRYFLKNFFEYLIERMRLLTLKELNSLILFFNYGILERHSLPSAINISTFNLNTNASQSKCLIHNLPFILYNFKDTPELQEMWKCAQSLLIVIKISYSNTITETDLEELDNAVSSHNKGMMECFGITLKPKHHNITHYSHLIRSVGPLVHSSTLRYKMKQKEFTQIAKTTQNFKNINKTIVRRHQQQSFFKEKYCSKKVHGSLRPVKVEILHMHAVLLGRFEKKNNILATKYLQLNNNRYEIGVLLQHESRFFEITHIFSYDDDFYFLCVGYDKNVLDVFLNSIELKKIKPEYYKLIPHNDLLITKSHDIKKLNDKCYVIIDSLDVKMD